MKIGLVFLMLIAAAMNSFAADTYTPPPNQLADGAGPRMTKKCVLSPVWIRCSCDAEYHF